MKTKIGMIAAVLMSGALAANAAESSSSAHGDHEKTLKRIHQGRAGIAYRVVATPAPRSIESSDPRRPVTIALSVEDEGWTITGSRNEMRKVIRGRSGYAYRRAAPHSGR